MLFTISALLFRNNWRKRNKRVKCFLGKWSVWITHPVLPNVWIHQQMFYIVWHGFVPNLVAVIDSSLTTVKYSTPFNDTIINTHSPSPVMSNLHRPWPLDYVLRVNLERYNVRSQVDRGRILDRFPSNLTYRFYYY